MSRQLSCVAILLAALLAPAGAQAPAAAPSTFDMLVIPIRQDGVPDAWKHSLPEVGPSFTVVDSLCPGEVVTLLVLLRGIGDEAQGQGRVTMSLREQEPTGEPGLVQDEISAWAGTLPPRKDRLLLSQANLGISYEASDPLGKHVFTLEAIDAATGAHVERSVDLTLVKWRYGEKPGTPEEYEGWREGYHRAPQPAQAVRAFLEFGELSKGDSWNFGVVGLFRTIFTDEPWLLEHLIATARTMDEDRQARTALLLALLGKLDRLPVLYPEADHAAQVKAALKDVAMPDAYGELKGPEQLDLLWGEFFASGRYRPVRQIVRAFESSAGGDPVALFRMSPRGDEDKALLRVRVGAQTAVSSFNNSVKQNPLVRQYAQWMLTGEPLSEKEQTFVSAALTVAANEARDEPPP